MSLINQMLQELDQRGAELAKPGGVSTSGDMLFGTSAVATGATTKHRAIIRWAGLALLLILLAFSLWYSWQHHWLGNQVASQRSNGIATVAKQAVLPTTSANSTQSVQPAQPAQSAQSASPALEQTGSHPSLTVAPVLTADAASTAPPLPATLALKLSADFDPDKVLVAREEKNTADLTQAAALAPVRKNSHSVSQQPAASPAEKSTLNPRSKQEHASETKPIDQPRSQTASNKVASASPLPAVVKEISPQQKAEGEYRQATQLQQQGRTAEAIAMLEQAIRTDPQHSAAFQLLIGLLIDSKRQDDAMRWLQQALQADGAQPRLSMILARLQVDQGQLASAIETLQKALPQAGEQSDYLAFLAALLQRDGRHKAAIDYYQRALKKNPQNALWWMGLGISRQADHHQSEALDAFKQAKSLGGLSNELLAFIDQRIAQLSR